MELSSLYGEEEPSPVQDVRTTIMPGSGTDAGSSMFNSHQGNHLPKSSSMSQSRKLSLDPYVRLKIEKLEVVRHL